MVEVQGQMRGRVKGQRGALWAALAVALWVAAWGVSAPHAARADYDMPTTAMIFRHTKPFTVIDAQVSGFDADGKGQLEVRAALLGESAPLRDLSGIVYTCMGGSWARYGVKAGERYVIFLLGDQMMEEQSYFQVVERGGAAYVALKPSYAKWLELGDGSAPVEVSLESLRTRLAEIQAAQAAAP
jgi:hypothetical protein